MERATRRRRRVLALLLLALGGVVAVCVAQRLAWPWVAIPAGLLVGWLVACRLMVKNERRPLAAVGAVVEPVSADTATSIPLEQVSVADAVASDATESPAAPPEPGLWDPVPVTLPTYVSKPAATRRSVRTIDLDATGVWTSGRTEADSALAREAEAADRVRRRTVRKDGSGEEAVGS
jgi:hypothetical protein